ncbi:nitroreductase family protein [Methylobacterium sp. CM6257]
MNRLPDGTLETTVAAAWSPSSSPGLQQWSVVAVSGEQKQKIQELVAATIPMDRIP